MMAHDLRRDTTPRTLSRSTSENAQPLTPVSSPTPSYKHKGVGAIRGNEPHPLLRPTVFALDSLSSLTDCNNMVADAARRGKLIMFGDTVQRYPRHDNARPTFATESSTLTVLPSKDPVWQQDGDCLLQPAGIRLNSQAIYDNNSIHLASLLSACAHDDYTHFKMSLPARDKSSQSIRDYNLAVRNFCAAISRMPIVGSLLTEALEDLQAISESFLGSTERAAAFVRRFVQSLKLDDCRYRSADIVRLLSWTEDTRWEKGYVETFAHCVGMINHGLVDQGSLDTVSTQTRELIGQSCFRMRENMDLVAAMLSGFDILGSSSALHPNQTAIQRSYSAFQTFLREYYGREFGKWPPENKQGKKHWLTRPLAMRLQDDFGGLYDLLVDGTTHWGIVDTETETEGPFFLDKESNRVPMADCSNFWASTFPLQSFMTKWNKKHGFEIMPHPFPLIPKFCNTDSPDHAGHYQSSLVPALRMSSEREPTLRDAYLHGTNKDAEVSRFCHAFIDHESKTHIAGVDTHDARLGRWVLIQCMMQLLSRIAVDVQGLNYRHGVEYFLNASIEGCPPWLGASIPPTMRQAGIQDSWAFILAKSVAENNRRKAREMQRQARKPRYKVEWQEDGRFKMIDSDGRVVFS